MAKEKSSDRIEIIRDAESLVMLAAQLEEKYPDLPEYRKLGTVFEDAYLQVKRDPVRFPSGVLGTYLRVIEKLSSGDREGVVLVPVLEEKLHLVRIFRHATRSWEVELPRGLSSGLDINVSITNETREELGHGVSAIEELGRIYPNSGILESSARVFLVSLTSERTVPSTEDTELIGDVIPLNLPEVRELIASGTVKDSFTISAVYLYELYRAKREKSVGLVT